jgi:hypothetical protein
MAHFIADATGQIFKLTIEERGRPFLGYFQCVCTYEQYEGKWLLCDIDWADDKQHAEDKLQSMLEEQVENFI